MKKYIQTQTFKLSGGGISLSDTSISLQSFKTPNGVPILMTDVGDVGYATVEPGTSKEEIVSFTGVTQNPDGTATLTGVTRGLKFIYPYDQDLSLRKSHSGSTSFVVTNNPQMYNNFTNKSNDEIVTGAWEFPAPTKDTSPATKKFVEDIAIAGAPDASSSTKGISKLSVAPVSASDPIVVGNNDPRLGDSSYSNKGLVQFNTDASTSGLSVASGVASVNTGTSANQIVKLDGTAKLPAVDGSNLTNIGKSASGTITISSSGTTTVTVGFRPKTILFYSSTTHATSSGGYSEEAGGKMFYSFNGLNFNGSQYSGGVGTNAALVIREGVNPADTTAIVNNVTSTGFDFVRTMGSTGCTVAWVAMG